MFDFAKIKDIVPDAGRLTMLFTKKGDELVVVYAPKVKENPGNQGFSPLTVRGTPEELNSEFEGAIADLAAEQKKLYELLKVKVSVAAKKAGVTKAADTKTAEIAKATGNGTTLAVTKTEEKKAIPPKPEPPPMMDLFSQLMTAKAEPATVQPEVIEAVPLEATVEDDTDILDELNEEDVGGAK